MKEDVLVVNLTKIYAKINDSNAASVNLWKKRIFAARMGGIELLGKQLAKRCFILQSRDSAARHQLIIMVAVAFVNSLHSAHILYGFDEIRNARRIGIPSLYASGAHDGRNVEAIRNFVLANIIGTRVVK